MGNMTSVPVGGAPAAIIVATPATPNPLQNASRNLMPDQAVGPNSKPAGWFLNDPTKTPSIPADQPKGKYFCSEFLRRGLMTRGQFIKFCLGHLKAIWTHGDFTLWYAKNGQRLVRNANLKNFDWKQMQSLAITRTQDIYEMEGFEAACRNYMAFCQAMYHLFGLTDPLVEPFRQEFYHSSFWSRKLSAVKLIFVRGSLKDLFANLKMQWRLRRF